MKQKNMVLWKDQQDWQTLGQSNQKKEGADRVNKISDEWGESSQQEVPEKERGKGIWGGRSSRTQKHFWRWRQEQGRGRVGYRNNL
jgi:hypothetical protein